MDKTQLRRRASYVFSKGAPIDEYDLFAGRVQQVEKIVDAVMQRGQHVIIFGERGVGKTSMANVLSDILENAGFSNLFIPEKVTCDGTDDFSSVWHKVFRGFYMTFSMRTMGFNSQTTTVFRTLADRLPPDVTPDDVRMLLRDVPIRTIVIIDELDSINDPKSTRLLADTVKMLSDHAIDTTLILVGVADSVDELITGHASIERSLLQIKMPRMMPEELGEIIDKGLVQLDMTIDADARQRIVMLSQGLPHYTHMLAYEATKNAIAADRAEIKIKDVQQGIKTAIEDADQSIKGAYYKAVTSTRANSLYAAVLLACALAPTDEVGYFNTGDVAKILSIIVDKRHTPSSFSRHMAAFSTEERGAVVQRVGSGDRTRYRFANPLMQPFVVMHGLAEGLISDKRYKKIKDETGE